jgi:uncharacterized protein (TIGR00266 family)
MQVDLKHKPAFTTINVHLVPGETLIAESDAMACMSAHVRLKPKLNGGLVRGLGRKVFGRESLFVNHFTVEGGEGDLVLSQTTPGDIVETTLNETGLFLQPGAFIACEPSVTLGLGWAGLRSWFGSEGLFRLHVSGSGRVWFGAYGAVLERDLGDEEYIVDTSHLLAYEPSVSMRVGMAGGIFSSFFSGEGFVSRMRGPGKIYLQNRSLPGLTAWTNAHIF